MSNRSVSPVFVGRQTELTALADALNTATKESTTTVLLSGEAGGGKTRLITRFAEEAAEKGAMVLIGGCLEMSAEGLPYAPFTAILRQLVREYGVEHLTGLLPEGAARDLARLLPEFGESPTDVDLSAVQARLFEQVLILLERLADQRPVVLIVEDAHWADRSSRDLFAFCVRNLRESPVLLVMTYRSDDMHRAHPLRHVLAELTRLPRVLRVDLPRFSRADVAAQIKGILDHDPGPALIDEVYGRSEGVPLFVEALAADAGHAVPGSLRDLLIAAIERLPEPTQRVLQLASGAGGRIGHELLKAIAGLDDHDLSERLRPAVTANVLVVEESEYAFRHALFREAVHEDLLPGEHVRLHTRLAEELEKNPSMVSQDRAPAEIAHHWYMAHDTVRALAAAWNAAGHAGRALAYAEQAKLLERVLELWSHDPQAQERTGHDHAEMLELAAQAATDAGEPERGIAFVRAAVDEAADPDHIARLHLLRAKLTAYLGRSGEVDDLRAALRLVPEPGTTRAKVLTRLGRVLILQGHYAEAAPLIAEAHSMAARLGDAYLEADASMSAAICDAHEGRLADALTELGTAREISQRIGSGWLQLRVLVNVSDVQQGMGDHEAAAATARDGLALAQRLGLMRISGGFHALNLAAALTAMGRWEEAIEVLDRALDAGPVRVLRAYLVRLRGELALDRGEADAASRAVTEAAELFRRPDLLTQEALPLARFMIAWRLSRDEAPQALEIVAGTLGNHDVAGNARYGWPLLVAGLAAVTSATTMSARLRDGELARRAEATRLALATARDRTAAPGPLDAAHRATFDAWAQDGAERWDDAAAAWEQLGQPFPQAAALVRAAEAAASSGDRDGAAVRLRDAARLADSLGARPLREEVRLLGRRVGIELGEHPAAAEPRPSSYGLTPRELEVLALVAEGHTNREIAEHLFISVKTASVHVSNILAKLGAATRGEAAATAHRLRLLIPAGAPAESAR